MFQADVRKNYDKLFDESYWKMIKTDGKTEPEVFEEVKNLVQETIIKPKSTDTAILWPRNENNN